MTSVLLMTLKVAVGLLIFGIGLGSTIDDLAYLPRRPRLLFKSLLAMYVLVPAAAVLLVRLWPLPRAVAAALLVLAVSAGAPLLPRKLAGFGCEAYSFSLVVLSSLLAIVLVPTWIALLGRAFEVTTDIPPASIARVIGMTFLPPLVIGVIVRALMGHRAEAIADRVMIVAGGALTASAVLLLATHWELLLGIRWVGMSALIVLLATALLIGHLMGGPDPGDRTALAMACATRHVGIAVLVATSFPGPRTATLIAAYIVAAVAVSFPYLRWRRHARSTSH